MSPFAEVTDLAFAGVVTSRAELTDWRYPTSEPEGSPARLAADGASAQRDTCGETEGVAWWISRAVKPFVAFGDRASLDETLGNANAKSEKGGSALGYATIGSFVEGATLNKYLHAGFAFCGLVAASFYVLSHITAAITFGVIGLGFEVAMYVLMFRAWRQCRAP